MPIRLSFQQVSWRNLEDYDLYTSYGVSLAWWFISITQIREILPYFCPSETILCSTINWETTSTENPRIPHPHLGTVTHTIKGATLLNLEGCVGVWGREIRRVVSVGLGLVIRIQFGDLEIWWFATSIPSFHGPTTPKYYHYDLQERLEPQANMRIEARNCKKVIK